MKIKAVCEATGLSDRTIRYYIEEGLITPKYTENYLGRKTFDFAQQDISKLNQIAVLRNFDFSIEEILSIIQDSSNSRLIIDAVKQRIEKTVSDGTAKLTVLMQLDSDKCYTLSQLAEKLIQVTSNTFPQNEKIINDRMDVLLGYFKLVLKFLIVWAPIISALLGVVCVVGEYCYPKYSLQVIIVICVCLIPSILLLVGAGHRFWKPKAVKVLLLCLCLVSVPVVMVSSVFIVSHSETTGIFSYRRFDAGCSVSQDLIFQELFPVNSPAPMFADKYSYYYRYSDFLDETYEVYAEWNLEKEKFDAEVSRVTQLFEDYAPTLSNEQQGSSFQKEQRGIYTCLILYSPYEFSNDFKSDTDKYYVFAYDSSNLIVRYIHSSSHKVWDEIPHLAQLEW